MDSYGDCKICNKCGEVKSLSLFYKNSRSNDGYKSHCKECCKSYYHKWKSDNASLFGERKDERTRQYKARKDDAVQYLGGVCEDCRGSFHNTVFDFHHVDPSSKLMDPHKALWRKDWKEEISKCALLCANCHRMRHVKEDYESIN